MRIRLYIAAVLLLSLNSVAQVGFYNPVSQQDTAVTVTPANPTIAVGTKITFDAIGNNSGQSYRNQCNWASSDPTKATNNLETFTGVSSGTTTVTCVTGVTGVNPAGISGSTVLTIAPSPLITVPSCGTPPCAIPVQGTAGVAYPGFTFGCAGGTPPYTWAVTVGSLPAAFTLSSGGALSSTSSEVAGNTTFSVTCTDSGSNVSSPLSVTLTVNASTGCAPGSYSPCVTTSAATIPGPNLPPAGLMGVNAPNQPVGTNNCVPDDINGNIICRVTDYTLRNASLPAGKLFTTPSSSTQRNQSASGGHGGTGILCLGDTGGFIDWFQYTPGSPLPTTTFRGRVSSDSAGNGLDAGCSFSAIQNNVFYTGGALTISAVATINAEAITTTGGCATTWSAACITPTVLLNPTNCPGLTSFNTGPNGPQWNRYLAAQAADTFSDVNDHVIGLGYRYAQDNNDIIVTYDSTKPGHGCRWVNMTTGLVGGDYGPTGALVGWGPIPPPSVSVTTASGVGGSLPAGHTLAYQFTYAVTGHGSNYGGESTPSTVQTVSIPSSPAGNVWQLQVTAPPVANPGGGTGINLGLTATGYNAYVCDRTVSPGCNPVLQANANNASGALAQPVISSITACSASGTNTYTYYVVALNAGGMSIPSAPVSVSGCAFTLSTAAPVINWSAVPNATSYCVLRDTLVVSPKCVNSPTVSYKDNNNLPGTFEPETTPIGVNLQVSSLATTSVTPPTVNQAGVPLHNWRMDQSGQFVTFTAADSFAKSQGSAPNATLAWIWPIATNNIFPCNGGAQTNPYVSYCAAHWTNQAGSMWTWPSSPLKSEWVQLNMSSTFAGFTYNFFNVANGGLDTQCTGQHESGNFSGLVTLDKYIAANGWALPTAPYCGELIGISPTGTPSAAWRFAHNRASATEGFSSTPRGNLSQDGCIYVFTSDMAVSNLGAPGQAAGTVGVGSNTGAATCTTGTAGNCAWEVYLVRLSNAPQCVTP